MKRVKYIDDIGRIFIPRDLRKKLNIDGGTTVNVWAEDDIIKIQKPNQEPNEEDRVDLFDLEERTEVIGEIYYCPYCGSIMIEGHSDQENLCNNCGKTFAVINTKNV